MIPHSRKIIFLFLIGFLSVFNCLGQGSSNKGTDFWLGYGKHVSVGDMVLYITSDVNTTSTVTIPALGFSQTVSVVANTVVPVDIPTSAHLNVDGLSNNGIHVTSLKPVIVYAHIYDSSVSGATLVLPVNTLGKDYYSINYKQISNSNGAVSWFFVVAVEDNTTVEITPTQDTQSGWTANTTHTVTLNKGQIYNVLGKFTNSGGNSYGGDLTGSRIKSISSNGTCKKVAVFSGSSKISINCLSYNFPNTTAPGSADNLIQQVYPTSTWGKNFITVPEKDRNFVIYRVLKSDPTAIVKLNGVVIASTSFVNNLYYDFASQQVDQVTSDKPIQLVQYAVTQNKSITCSNAGGDVGDPEMIYLNPLEQTLTQITMYSTPRFLITKHFINVVIKNEGVANFKLDGVNASSNFSVVPGNLQYSYAQLSVQAGTHNLSSDVGFNAIAYGFGAAESYGYAAGANLTSFGIDPVKNGTDSTSVATGCVGTPYNINLKLPYEPLDLQLDKLDGTGLKYITVNKIGQSTKDGVITYVYSLLPNLVYTKDSTYTYKVRTTKPSADDCGTGDEFTFDFIVNPKPVADFNVSSQSCFGDSVKFTNVVVDNKIVLQEYLWDFNSEGSSTLQNPSFKFLTTGVKNIRFSVKSQDGCWSDITTKTTDVMQLPVVSFTTSAITCLNQAIQFTDATTAVGQTISSWIWDFGDGSAKSNVQNPTHAYNTVGNYNVTLTVITNLGCTNKLLKPIKINSLPIVDFDTPDICLNDASAKFTNKSTIDDNSTLSYVWDFGDNNSTPANNTSTQPNPLHKYTQAKNYDVKLTTTSANGCVTTLSKVFTVNGSTPKSNFEVLNDTKLCSDQIVSFRDVSTVDFGEITKIEWIYDDLQPTLIDTDNDPNKRTDVAKIYTHQYPVFYSPATRSVIVTMKAYSGVLCVSTISKTIILKAIPKPDFALPNACLPNGEAKFTNNSTFNNSTTGLTYAWDFGDNQNNTSTDKDPIHQYKYAQNYTVKLTVTSANGCSATISKIFTVSAALPNPGFSVVNDDLCSNFKVLFRDEATIAFGEITKIEWQFDAVNHPNDPVFGLIDNNPNFRTDAAKIYQFAYPKFNSPLTKDFKVVMTTTSATGCVSQISKTITLKAVPNLVFNVLTAACEEYEPYLITQANETTGFPGKGSYSGTGINASGLFSPKIAGVGTHSITYTFTGDNGCSDFKTQDITVNPTPSVNAGVDKNILIGGQITLDATASGNNLSYKWSPSTGLNKDDILNPIASPIKDTKYTLLVTSQNGCINIDDVFIKVLLLPEIPNTFTPNGDGVNDIWDIKYLSSYPSVTIQVFNRDGNLVYNALSYTSAWDGKFNNKDLPQGIYYYIITAKQGELKYSGSVLIVR
ncbi:hypothetical protein A5893_02810 [Pedobacter psychrophilus]|uniref:PKD domain-containing protein n=1 Tax=Pedobacter psychrophilus TaxID=1826909 RepID=A0A179DNH4_9SPHI|nr:PKD domain-containing protein [Pedobacter psychrophilus]OAQ42063.1 hypothetical protein A5893_02810 [Pedobacter psychrophilus]